MPTNTGERVFTSWKEIASFFGKGVRTVQRWERKFGLPISRPTAAKNVVLATESELREWIRSSSQLDDGDGAGLLEDSRHNGSGSFIQFETRLKRLEDDTARLARIVTTFSDRLDKLSSNGSGQKVVGRTKAEVVVVNRSSSKASKLLRK
jgi:phage terminase Nu1 subunit (DNA packaging protein)